MKRPRIPSGKRRPCGTLLQLVVANLNETHSISRSVEAVISVAVEQNCNTTHFGYDCSLFTLSMREDNASSESLWGTSAGGQFGWGGALSKKYR